MVTRLSALLLLLLLAVEEVLPAEPPSAAGGQVKTLVGEFRTASEAAVRAEALGKLLAHGESGARLVTREIDNELAAVGREYAQSLPSAIRAAYVRKLESLSDEQVLHILRTRFLWEPYILNGGSHPRFREVYLAPISEMKESLLPSIDEILDPKLKEMRARLTEYAGYQSRCHEVLKIDPDPTAGKLSPTNIAYARLDQPPTTMDRLRHFERTLILINTVASAAARGVLLMCEQAAREIDVQEAEFVLAANEVRMLAGSIAWRVDPLGCAVARDHSNDRKEGRAKGHMSDVPGKRGFTDRNKRMGAAFYGSEGAGGGRDGRSYLNGLSYSGDGHGGPLYRLARNRVGVGRRDGVYTSQYGTDKQYVHPCPATDGELWMPPGVSARDLRVATVRRACSLMKNSLWGRARSALDQTKSATGIDAVALRFFRTAIDLKVEQTINEILATEQSGDVYLASVQLQRGLTQFSGIDEFEAGVEAVSARLQAADLRNEMMAGQEYYRLCANVKDLPKERFNAGRGELIRRLQLIAQSLKNSAYGQAADLAARRLTDPESDADALLEYFDKRREASGGLGP